MPRVVFAQVLQRHVDCPPRDVVGSTVRAALNCVFEDNPRVRGYVLDDQAQLRKHMTIFVDGRAIRDRTTLSDAVQSNSEIYVLQALSGG
jgi:molybdopterin synthase sulfur carrier subunit